jgi:hypothetical protein
VCGETEPQYQQPPQYPQSQYQPPVAPQYEQTQYQQPYQQQYSPPQYQPQYQPPGGKARHGFTTFWLVLLTIAFGGVFAISIILFATDDEAFLIFSPPAGLAALGLFMLLHWKRAGFWIVCLASVISISILFTGVIYNEELIYLTVLSSLFLTGSVYGVLMLRGLNGKNAWEQFQGRTKHER